MEGADSACPQPLRRSIPWGNPPIKPATALPANGDPHPLLPPQLPADTRHAEPLGDHVLADPEAGGQMPMVRVVPTEREQAVGRNEQATRRIGAEESDWILQLRKVGLHALAISDWEIDVDTVHVIATELRAAYVQMGAVWKCLPEEFRIETMDGSWWVSEARASRWRPLTTRHSSA